MGEKMEMDLTFKTGHGRFNYRVGAIIIHNGCYLLMRNPEASYLYTVGGRVHYGETTEEAVVREIMEETGVRLEPERPVFFMEQIFDEEVTYEDVKDNLGPLDLWILSKLNNLIISIKKSIIVLSFKSFFIFLTTASFLDLVLSSSNSSIKFLII